MTEPTITVFSLKASQDLVDDFLKNQSYQNLDIVSFEETDTYDDLVSYIKGMETDYFCFIENNHIYSPDKIRKMWGKMINTPQADMCVCLRQTVNEKLEIIAPEDLVITSSFKEGLYNSKTVLQIAIEENKNVYGDLSCIMVSRKYAQSIDWFSINAEIEEFEKTSLLFQILSAGGAMTYLFENLVSVVASSNTNRNLNDKFSVFLCDFTSKNLLIDSYKNNDYEQQKVNVKKEITFFYTDKGEYYNLEPIEKEARRRGYETKFTEDTNEKAEIGVYCQHVCRPENSKFSLILLHDMAQGHNRWPNIWAAERWNGFDIGIVPGFNWKSMWETCANQYYANPRRGAYVFGYPKSDYVASEDLANRVEEIKQTLNLKYDFSVLYAPSWENDEKEDDFVRALASLPVNLLIKQAHWPKQYQFVIDDIKKMRQMHEGKYENVYYIEPKESIMTALSLCDMVVSDESSVMVEALMFGKPSVAVYDWLIPDTNPKRFASVPMEKILKCKKVELREMVEKLSTNKTFYAESVKSAEGMFVNQGNVNSLIMDSIDYYLGESDDTSFMEYKMKSKYEMQSLWN